MPTLSYLDRVKKKLQNLFKHVQNKIMMMKKKEKLLRFKQLAKKATSRERHVCVNNVMLGDIYMHYDEI